LGGDSGRCNRSECYAQPCRRSSRLRGGPKDDFAAEGIDRIHQLGDAAIGLLDAAFTSKAKGLVTTATGKARLSQLERDSGVKGYLLAAEKSKKALPN
jgi:hypothetical protein